MLARLRRSLTPVVAVAALGILPACGGREGADSGPHATLACVGCHRGVAADSGRAPVADRACTDRGCHPGGGADTVRLAMVRLVHRNHPDGKGGVVPCAACHTHAPGSSTIVTDTTACALCHVKDLAESGGRQPSCRSCHPTPRHQPATNQGVPIEHAQIDANAVPCTRCHYQVVEGDRTAVGSCARCHADTALTAAAGADSVHARHRDYRCAACHQPVRHRVVAMSTSVDLNCLDCHTQQHRRANHPANVVPSARCDGCHTDVHAEEQRLILGLLPGEPIRPSPMFMGGVTCRSCHVVPGQITPRALRSNEAACTGCHGVQWAGYLGRWRRGFLRREAWVNAYLGEASRAFADSARAGTARAQVRQAQGLMAFLRGAGPLHNLPAADRIMRDALELTARAYRAAGRTVPPRPELGPPVLAASCMSCHYGIEEVGADRDSTSGVQLSHADHLFRAYLPCDACHAVGAAPPGLPDSLWIDTLRLDRGGPARRRRTP